jgi:YebC/PmpR family DNA-binding regulatory protein
MGRAFEYRRASKEKRWDKMSKLFPKLGKAITMAAKEGGPEPATNAKLRTAIQNAKAENMPKDNIENAIKRAAQKDIAAFTQVDYEGKGPHGVLVYVECATDNPTRTVANVKSYFNKAGGQVVPNGSLEFMFNRKCVFEIVKTDAIDPEELELNLIDAGCEEIDVAEDRIFVYGDYTSFGTLSQALDELKIEVAKSNLQRIPSSPVEFTEEQLVDIEKMLDKIEDDDDIQQVFTNIA